ncbi:hypothetical protein L9F63_023714, partial [Diploptera punctata]
TKFAKIDTGRRKTPPMNEKNQLNNDEQKKPLFITTVKTGKFLDPPPELAVLLGLTHNLNDSMTSSTNGSSNSLNASIKDRHQQQVLLYSFSSQPRVLHQHHHRSRCDAAAKVANNIQQRNRNIANQDKTFFLPLKISKLKKNDEDDGPETYGNIMYDRRVVRGSTYLNTLCRLIITSNQKSEYSKPYKISQN